MEVNDTERMDGELTHGCPVMRIDLNAMRYNLERFRSVIAPTTKVMMIIKASAYGTGVQQVGRWAAETRLIDYLGVAYTAEGVELREARINLPIMVMNIDKSDFDACQTFQLEPVIYSLSLLTQLTTWLENSEQG